MDTHHTQYSAPASPARTIFSVDSRVGSRTPTSSRSPISSPTRHASRPSEGFFTRLSMSFASALRTMPDEDRAKEAELEWSCRGTDHGAQYWGPSALVQEDYPYFGARRGSTQSLNSGPTGAGRPPSLTHSRGSSTDSGFTSDSFAYAERYKQLKPLPAIPDIPDIYTDKSGAAVAALLTRSGSDNSSEEIARAQLAIQQLDLAVPSELSFLNASPVPSTISTLRRPVSICTAGGSPRTVWTPRGSCFGTPGTISEEAFAFEHTLAAYDEFDKIASRQQALDRLNNKAPKPRRTQSIKEQFPYFADIDEEPECEVLDAFTPPADAADQRKLIAIGTQLEQHGKLSSESVESEDSASTYKMLESALLDMLTGVGPDISPDVGPGVSHSPGSPATSFVLPVSDGEDEMMEAPAPPGRISHRASINYGKHKPTGSNSGWRGWRASTHICTITEVAEASVPDFVIEAAATPAFSTFQTAEDYFADVQTGEYNDVSGSPTISSKLTIPSANKSPSSGSLSLRSLSIGESAALPKLSPEFRFGTSRASTPVPLSPVQPQRFSQASQSSVYSVDSTYNVDSQARRLRSASANELRSKAAEGEATFQSQQQNYRMRRGMRSVHTAAPSMQMRSFDADALRRLRASSTSANLYEWI